MVVIRNDIHVTSSLHKVLHCLLYVSRGYAKLSLRRTTASDVQSSASMKSGSAEVAIDIDEPLHNSRYGEVSRDMHWVQKCVHELAKVDTVVEKCRYGAGITFDGCHDSAFHVILQFRVTPCVRVNPWFSNGKAKVFQFCEEGNVAAIILHLHTARMLRKHLDNHVDACVVY